MTTLGFIRDVAGFNTFGLPFSDYKYSTTLAAGVVQTLTVPHVDSGKDEWLAIFSPEAGASVWIANNETAEIPTGAFALTTSEYNPTARYVKGGDVLSFITSDTTATIGVTFYSNIGR